MGRLVSLVDGGYRDARIPKKVDLFDAANYFLTLMKAEEGSLVTMPILQKLCFYTQAWSLVWDHTPIFNEQFEPGEQGPFNKALFQKYKEYVNKPIPGPDMGFDADVFTDKQKDMLDAVWDSYGIHGLKYEEKSEPNMFKIHR